MEVTNSGKLEGLGKAVHKISGCCEVRFPGTSLVQKVSPLLNIPEESDERQ